MSERRPGQSPLSVAVLLDLHRSVRSGGHVKCWERIAEAALDRDDVDLTLYALGTRNGTERLGGNVRYVTLRPVLPSDVLSRALSRDVDSTDLAPFHPSLARRLGQHDLWHATHTFAFAQTARVLARRRGVPLVASVHTDMPRLTRIYTRRLVRTTLGCSRITRLLLDQLALDRVAGQRARHARDNLLRACGHVLVSNDADRVEIGSLLGPKRVSRLRRGIDNEAFHPRHRDRERLRRTFGVPTDRPLVLFAGRVDETKRATTVARAVRLLQKRGTPVHLLVAGEGADTPAIRRMLGTSVTMPGTLPQNELAWVYASADAFALPSETETVGNVVGEAMSAGVAVLLPWRATTSQWLPDPRHDGILVPEQSDDAWADALAGVLTNPRRCMELGRRARTASERRHPTWQEVLDEDLLPVWRRLDRRLWRRWAASAPKASAPKASAPKASAPKTTTSEHMTDVSMSA